jgi:hypothetical protein
MTFLYLSHIHVLCPFVDTPINPTDNFATGQPFILRFDIDMEYCF